MTSSFVPVMTSNTTPSGLAFSNSVNDDSFSWGIYKAFDGNLDTLFISNLATPVYPTVLGYRSASTQGFKVDNITYKAEVSAGMPPMIPPSINGAPTNFKVQGSNNTTTGLDGTWDDLATFNPTWELSEDTQSFQVSSDTAYIAHRISVSSWADGPMLKCMNLVFNGTVAPTLNKPYTFTSGTTASAGEVNANFDTLYDYINNSGVTLSQVQNLMYPIYSWSSSVIAPGMQFNGMCFTSDGDILSISTTGKVYKSTNQTYTWSERGTVSYSGIMGNIIQTTNGDMLAVDQYNKVYRSTDVGLTWDSGVTLPYDDFYNTVIELSPNNLIVAGGWGVYKSSNNGVTWGSRITFPVNLGFNPNCSMVKLANGNLLVGGSQGKVYKSADDGNTWDTGTVVSTSHYLYKLYQMSNGFILASDSYDGKVYQSTDDGATWAEFTTIRSGYTVGSMIQAPGTSYQPMGTVYASVGDSIYQSQDLGGTWSSYRFNSTGGLLADIVQLANGNVLAVSNSFDRIFKSTNNGMTWDASTGGTLVKQSSGLSGIAQAVNGDVLVTNAGAQGFPSDGKVYKSTDNGTNWDSGTIVGTGMDEQLTAIHTLANGTMLCSNSQAHIYQSINNGISWTTLSTISGMIFRVLAIVQKANGQVFVLTEGMGTTIYKSTDNGATWDSGTVVVGMYQPQDMTVLLNGDLLLIENTSGRVYRSTDDGISWDTGISVETNAWLSGIVQLNDGILLIDGDVNGKVYKNTVFQF